MYKINLLPEEIKSKIKDERNYSFLIILAYAVIIILIFNISHSSFELKRIKNETKDYLEMLKENKNIKDIISDEGNNLNREIKRYNSLAGLCNSRSNFTDEIITLSEILPDHLWLNSIEFSKKENEEIFELKGITVNTQTVSEFMKNIRNRFDKINKLKLRSSASFKSGGKDFLRFELYLSLGNSNGK